MIEIKSVGGRVLYTAKDAKDVREAVQEAAKERADLAGANLARAYLAGADLAGANLAGANLARANLAGAYLKNKKKLVGERPIFQLSSEPARPLANTVCSRTGSSRLRSGLFRS